MSETLLKSAEREGRTKRPALIGDVMTGRKSKRERRVRPMEFLRVGIFHMSQRAFAEAIGMPQRTISHFELGEPTDDDKLPIFVLARARRYALLHRMEWPLELCEQIIIGPCILVEE